ARIHAGRPPGLPLPSLVRIGAQQQQNPHNNSYSHDHGYSPAATPPPYAFDWLAQSLAAGGDFKNRPAQHPAKYGLAAHPPALQRQWAAWAREGQANGMNAADGPG
ncbi:hypothetical protein, partial [Lysobacter antibioticus]|uniref:hypothetical protein n=1 Tax=Lysobacter antibioticus TaxID=84531 RepID=UPI001F2B0F16